MLRKRSYLIESQSVSDEYAAAYVKRHKYRKSMKIFIIREKAPPPNRHVYTVWMQDEQKPPEAMHSVKEVRKTVVKMQRELQDRMIYPITVNKTGVKI